MKIPQVAPFINLQSDINKAGSTSSNFRNNRLMELYQSEPVRLYILKIKIDVENSELSPFMQMGTTQNLQFTEHYP